MRDSEGKLVLDDNGNPMMGKKNVSTTAYYVELPVKANYYIELRPLHYIELSAGPYAAVGVGGKRKTRGDTDETDELLDDCAYTIQVLTEKIAELVTLTRPMRPASAPIRNNLIAE